MTNRPKMSRVRRSAPMRGGLVVAAVLLALGLAGCGDDSDSAGSDDTTSAETSPSEDTEEPTEEPTEATEEDSSAPSDTAAPDEADEAAANAPKDASVDDFCTSFDLQKLSQLSGSGDLSKLQGLQADMLAVGTPADMSDQARSGWEWFASINGPEDLSKLNNDHVTALGQYYGQQCV